MFARSSAAKVKIPKHPMSTQSGTCKMVSEKCRLCLSESLEIQSIFDTQLYQSVPLALKIAVCTSLAITHEDPFSKYICKDCRMYIDKFYCFRESCMKNYVRLLGVECSRVSELEELMKVSCDTDVKSDQHKNKDKITAGGKSQSISVKRISRVTSQDGSSRLESGNSKRGTLAQESTNCQTSDTREGVTFQEETEAEDKVAVQETDNGGGNMYTGIYSELQENVDVNSQYIITEEVLEEQLDENEVEETTVYSNQVDTVDEQLEVEETEDQGFHYSCGNCLKIFLTSNALTEHYEEGECHPDTVEVLEDELLIPDERMLEAESQTNDVLQTGAEQGASFVEGHFMWGEKRRYQCETCKKFLNTRAGLVNHVRVHTGERPFVCTQCSRSFSQKGALLNHERKHRGEWPYPCQECGKGFFRPSDLEKHFRCHTDERPFLCSVCSKSFHQMSGLTVHERVHSGERPYSCSICKMTFTQLSNKYRHMKTHADGKKPFACDICHRKYADKSELQIHQAVHQGAKPRICHYCNKGFRKPYELRDHLRRSHTNERPYTCQLCNKSFFVAHDLKNHLYIHTGERPFSCTVCLLTFTQSGNLKRHHLRHHPEVPLPKVSTKQSPFLVVQEVKVEPLQVQDFEVVDEIADPTDS